MAVAAPPSSASLEPTKITTRIARPVDHNCSRPTTAICLQWRRHAGARDPPAKTAQHELSTGHCEIRQISARDDPRGRHVAQSLAGASR
jgi:hypothetical protein